MSNKIVISVVFLFVSFLIYSSFAIDEDLQMTCVDDKADYCKRKYNGCRFIDGCHDCVCQNKSYKCSSGTCKYMIKKVDEAFDYCEKIAKKNKLLYKTGLNKNTKNEEKNKNSERMFTIKSKINKHNKKSVIHNKVTIKNRHLRKKFRKYQRKYKRNVHNKKSQKKLLKHFYKKFSLNKRSNKRMKPKRKHKYNHKKIPKYHFRKFNNRLIRRHRNRKVNYNGGYKYRKKTIKRQIYEKNKMIIRLQSILSKHHRTLKYLVKLYRKNRKTIKFLKRKLLKVIRYNGILVVLQREVADLLIANRKFRLRIRRLNLLVKKYNGKSPYHRSRHRLKKRYEKMFKNKKQRAAFLRQLEMIKKRRKKFNRSYENYFDKLRHSTKFNRKNKS